MRKTRINLICRVLHLHRANTAHPPTFIFHTADNPVVPMQLSLRYADACRQAGISVELHVYERGVHGVGLAIGNPSLCGWTRVLLDGLKPWAS
ncbi:MAG: hypothetical protein WCH84_07890 [Verrucomicrobiota bacterium]